MVKLFGAQKLVLQAIQDSPEDAAGFVTDNQVAESTCIGIEEVRDWFETLEGGGYVEVAQTTAGLRALITANGRLALGQYRPFSPSTHAPDLQAPKTSPSEAQNSSSGVDTGQADAGRAAKGIRRAVKAMSIKVADNELLAGKEEPRNTGSWCTVINLLAIGSIFYVIAGCLFDEYIREGFRLENAATVRGSDAEYGPWLRRHYWKSRFFPWTNPLPEPLVLLVLSLCLGLLGSRMRGFPKSVSSGKNFEVETDGLALFLATCFYFVDFCIFGYSGFGLHSRVMLGFCLLCGGLAKEIESVMPKQYIVHVPNQKK
jgi:hypothetical protein